MSESFDSENKLVIAEVTESQAEKNEPSTSGMSGDKHSRRVGRRPGRRSSKMDMRAKLERSRQSARECRARKKLRYQYLEDLVANREKAVFALRDELELYKQWCIQLDKGLLPLGLLKLARESEKAREIGESSEMPSAAVGSESSDTATAVTEPDALSESSDDDGVEEQPIDVDTLSPESSLNNTSLNKLIAPPLNIGNHKGSVFKVPKLKTSTSDLMKCDSGIESGATRFLSDLSSYSTIGVSDLEHRHYNVHSTKKTLGTLVEEESQKKDTIPHPKHCVELPLLPTFDDDFQNN